MKNDAQFIINHGKVTALAGGPLSLADLGDRQTRRVSQIEFNSAIQRWEVRDMQGTFLAEFSDYDEALAWERAWFNHRIEILA